MGAANAGWLRPGENGGERRIRTAEGENHQIYSLAHLAALEPPLERSCWSAASELSRRAASNTHASRPHAAASPEITLTQNAPARIRTRGLVAGTSRNSSGRHLRAARYAPPPMATTERLDLPVCGAFGRRRRSARGQRRWRRRYVDFVLDARFKRSRTRRSAPESSLGAVFPGNSPALARWGALRHPCVRAPKSALARSGGTLACDGRSHAGTGSAPLRPGVRSNRSAARPEKR